MRRVISSSRIPSACPILVGCRMEAFPEESSPRLMLFSMGETLPPPYKRARHAANLCSIPYGMMAFLSAAPIGKVWECILSGFRQTTLCHHPSEGWHSPTYSVFNERRMMIGKTAAPIGAAQSCSLYCGICSCNVSFVLFILLSMPGMRFGLLSACWA